MKFESTAAFVPDYDDITVYLPRNISTDIDSYNFFSKLSENTHNLRDEKIIVDFINNEWFDANVCSILGALIHTLIGNGNKVEIANISPDVENLFERNYFFKLFMNDSVQEYPTYHTMIPCACFLAAEGDKFVSYIDQGLLSMTGLPIMSARLKKKINERLLEIFLNAHEHGKCRYLYCSGQLFPKKGKISFTLCNTGTTIRRNVSEFLNRTMTGGQALDWAVKEGNTTRCGNIPGGLGLSLIRDFLTLNSGNIQIISCNGIWQEHKGKESLLSLKNRFNGTIVNIDINMNDNNMYQLASEKFPDNNGR